MKKILSFFMSILIFSLIIVNTTYASEIKEKYVNFNGTSIYTECYNYRPNAKEAIIYIHGLGDNHSGANFLHDSKNPYMTISYDNFNHGKTGHVSSEAITWRNQLGAINDIINAYGLKKVYLVGHSIGADIAMMFTKKYPEKVKKVVLVDRAYYNYSDIEKLNFTRHLTCTLGYDPQIGMEKDVFRKYVDMVSDNDITKTWNIKKQVLLLAADPKTILPDGVNPSLVDLVKMVKQSPEQFGVTPEDAAKLPDLTVQDLENIATLLKSKASHFSKVNHKFHVINTPYSHNMVTDANSRDTVRDYVLNFFKD